jgi:hypothetical protein
LRRRDCGRGDDAHLAIALPNRTTLSATREAGLVQIVNALRRLIPSLPTSNSLGSPADSHHRVILARPGYALFPAKICFKSHGWWVYSQQCTVPDYPARAGLMLN